LAVLSAVAEYYRLLDQRGYASSTIEKMAQSAQVRSIDITNTIKSLVARSLIAVVPGSGRWANEYRPCLPRRVAAAMTASDTVPRRRGHHGRDGRNSNLVEDGPAILRKPGG
jgi:hypothetical protein